MSLIYTAVYMNDFYMVGILALNKFKKLFNDWYFFTICELEDGEVLISFWKS